MCFWKKVCNPNERSSSNNRWPLCDRLRNELNEVQLVRRHLLEENNDMQKKLNYENDAIPRMEKELKVLADENNYLKLLCKLFVLARVELFCIFGEKPVKTDLSVIAIVYKKRFIYFLFFIYPWSEIGSPLPPTTLGVAE